MDDNSSSACVWHCVKVPFGGRAETKDEMASNAKCSSAGNNIEKQPLTILQTKQLSRKSTIIHIHTYKYRDTLLLFQNNTVHG